MASFVDRLSAAGRALAFSPPSGEVLLARKVEELPPNVSQAPAIERKASEAAKHTWFYRQGIEQFPPSGYDQLVKKYRRNAVVRRCVKLISECCAAIEPVVKINGKEDDRAAAAVREWIKRPNPMQSRVVFIEALAGFYILHGNGFIEFVPLMGRAAEFYPLRPELMTILPGADGWPQAYNYRPRSGNPKKWPVQIQKGQVSVLHLKDFAPDDDLWGRGALESCERELESYENAWDQARALLKNGAMPSGALKYAPKVVGEGPEPTLSEEQFQRLKASLKEQSTMAKKGTPMLLEGGLEWVPFSMTMVEAGAEEIRNGAARGICLAFGVPPMILGVPGDNTYSNFSEANRALFRTTVIPLAQKLWGAIGCWWSQLAPDHLKGLELEIDTDKVYALAEEITDKWRRLDESKDLTINEKREAKGYQKRAEPEADMLFMDSFNQPLGALTRTAEAGAESSELGAVQQRIVTEYQLSQPGYDPSADADGDGQSNDGTGKKRGEGTLKPAAAGGEAA